jgi:hypothetical protein
VLLRLQGDVHVKEASSGVRWIAFKWIVKSFTGWSTRFGLSLLSRHEVAVDLIILLVAARRIVARHASRQSHSDITRDMTHPMEAVRLVESAARFVKDRRPAVAADTNAMARSTRW